MASCESPGVYLPTEAQRSPADDWSDWTSFTLELEVHPTTGADGSSLRYIYPLFFFPYRYHPVFSPFVLGPGLDPLAFVVITSFIQQQRQHRKKEQGTESSVRDFTGIRARCHTIGRLARRSLVEAEGHCRQTHARRPTSPRIRSRTARLRFPPLLLRYLD